MLQKRRKLVFGATALAVQACGGAFARVSKEDRQSTVHLSDFGGHPEASGESIVSAFREAFEHLKIAGGGTLKVGPGVYHLGSFSNIPIIEVADLHDVLISAYGAQITIRTLSERSEIRPIIFNFRNPDNITIAGMSFHDSGTNLSARSGATCINVVAKRRCSNFKTMDCIADNVISFLRSDQKSNPYLFERFDIHATVKNSYYGVTPHKSGRFSRCRLNCLNVRRAFISHSARDWDIDVTTRRSGGAGSNAHVVLCAFPDGPVQDCNVNIKASGALSGYGSLGELIHQGENDAYSCARNVKFNFHIHDASSAAGIGVISFAAEPESGGGMRTSTVGSWENIQVMGTVAGPYDGCLVANPSVSRAPTNSICIDPRLAKLQDVRALPKYFHVKSCRHRG